jgi:thioredoxin 1
MIEVIKFGADWCGPCRMISPIIENLKNKYNQEDSDVQITSIDIDQNPEFAREYKIQSIPAFVFKKEGKLISKKTGVLSESQIEDLIKQTRAYELGE